MIGKHHNIQKSVILGLFLIMFWVSHAQVNKDYKKIKRHGIEKIIKLNGDKDTISVYVYDRRGFMKEKVSYFWVKWRPWWRNRPTSRKCYSDINWTIEHTRNISYTGFDRKFDTLFYALPDFEHYKVINQKTKKYYSIIELGELNYKYSDTKKYDQTLISNINPKIPLYVSIAKGMTLYNPKTPYIIAKKEMDYKKEIKPLEFIAIGDSIPVSISMISNGLDSANTFGVAYCKKLTSTECAFSVVSYRFSNSLKPVIKGTSFDELITYYYNNKGINKSFLECKRVSAITSFNFDDFLFIQKEGPELRLNIYRKAKKSNLFQIIKFK